MENKEILRGKKTNTQKSSSKYESELWKAIQVITEHKLNIYEKQDDIKHLKEECDIDDKNEVQEISAWKHEQKRKRLAKLLWQSVKQFK